MQLKGFLGFLKGLSAGHPLLLPIVQLELHPSPSVKFPSSHSYVPAVMLSPHSA